MAHPSSKEDYSPPSCSESERNKRETRGSNKVLNAISRTIAADDVTCAQYFRKDSLLSLFYGCFCAVELLLEAPSIMDFLCALVILHRPIKCLFHKNFKRYYGCKLFIAN